MSGGVCVVGSFMMDLVASAPRRPMPGETLVGTDFSSYLGGKGFNQAVAAARAGARTSLIGRLGDDEFGATFRDALRIEEIRSDGVVVDGEAGTGVGLPVVEPDGQNSIIIVPRANLRVDVRQIESARGAIAEADVLLLQLELPVETALAAARIARQAGTSVVLNPAPSAALPDTLLACVDIVVPNEVELIGLAGLPGADIEDAARVLQRRWRTDVVVTLGSHGVLVLRGEQPSFRVAPHSVLAVDTVGAGDTFCGNLGASLSRGEDLLGAVDFANAAAALAVTRHGAAEAAPRRPEVQAFLMDTARRRLGHGSASSLTVPRQQAYDE